MDIKALHPVHRKISIASVKRPPSFPDIPELTDASFVLNVFN